MVTVFLLHDLRDDGLREQVPGGDQAGLAIHPQGRRPLRVGSGKWWRSRWSIAISSRRMTTRCQTLKDIRYDRWREFDPEDSLAVLHTAHAGDGHDQVEPATDHRQRNGLALPRRVEARAENLIPFVSRGDVDMQIIQSRRRFLAGLSAAGAASLVGVQQSLPAEPPPETTSVRLAKIRGICIAPQYVAEELLHAEGFTEVRYVMTETAAGQSDAVASGQVDFTLNFAAPLVVTMDAGGPITVLAGVHPGCFELFGNENIRGIRDLKGKSVGVQALGSSPHRIFDGHGGLCRAGSSEGHKLGHQPRPSNQ